jgi:hypothetical protein
LISVTLAPTVRVPIFSQYGGRAAWLLVHPQQVRGELVGHLRRIAGGGDHVAAADVDLVGQRQRDRLAAPGHGQLAVRPEHRAMRERRPDGSTTTASPARGARREGAGETAEIQVRAVDPLHRQAQAVPASPLSTCTLSRCSSRSGRRTTAWRPNASTGCRPPARTAGWPDAGDAQLRGHAR